MHRVHGQRYGSRDPLHQRQIAEARNEEAVRTRIGIGLAPRDRLVSQRHVMAAKPKLKDFVAQYAKMWGKGGPLERRGLVPFGGADATAATAQSTALKPLDPSGLK